MIDPAVFFKSFRRKFIDLKIAEDDEGRVKWIGILAPLSYLFRLPVIMYLQSKLYSRYNVATWKGKRVASPFAPPVGSRAQYRALKCIAKSNMLGRSYPLAVTLAVTYRCQLNCPHCSAGRRPRKGSTELTTEEMKRVIDECIDIGLSNITFTGGEPLVREDIFDLIAYVDGEKAITSMFTNGLLLTDDVLDKLKSAGLYSLFVSLDSADSAEHDRLRGHPGSFQAAVDGIERALSKGMMACISSYSSRSNVEQHHYERIHKLGKELGVSMIILFDCVPTGTLLHDTSEMMTLEQKQVVGKYNADAFEKGINPMLASQAWQNSVVGYLSGIGCLAGHLQYYISAYGDVTPCDFSPICFGNVRQESIKSIWKKIIKHPAYNHISRRCRMQNPSFRQHYVDPIPDNAILPYPIEKLPRLNYRTSKL